MDPVFLKAYFRRKVLLLLYMNIKNSWSFYRASCPFILTESDFILNPKHYFTLTALAAILQICKKPLEKKTFQQIVEKSFSHILLNHKAFNRTAGYGHYRVLYRHHF